MGVVVVETNLRPNIEEVEYIIKIEGKSSWITSFKDFLLNGTLPKDRNKVHKLLRKVPLYLLQGNILYQRDFSALLLRWINLDEAQRS